MSKTVTAALTRTTTHLNVVCMLLQKFTSGEMPPFSFLYNRNKKEFTSQKVFLWIKLILYGKCLEQGWVCGIKTELAAIIIIIFLFMQIYLISNLPSYMFCLMIVFLPLEGHPQENQARFLWVYFSSNCFESLEQCWHIWDTQEVFVEWMNPNKFPLSFLASSSSLSAHITPSSSPFPSDLIFILWYGYGT